VFHMYKAHSLKQHLVIASPPRRTKQSLCLSFLLGDCFSASWRIAMAVFFEALFHELICIYSLIVGIFPPSVKESFSKE
jgi:hypothetical protein